jgi:hypothetical protein
MAPAAACAYAPAASFPCADIAVLLGTVIAVSILVVSIIILPVAAVSAALILVGVLAADPPGDRKRYRT